MRVAISTDGDHVSAHFGRCPSFTIIDIEESKVTQRESIANPGHQPGSIPQFLHQKGVSCIVCGGMGRRAVNFFEQYKIETIIGVTGTIDEVIKKLEQGTLEGGPSLCKPGAGKGYGVEKDVCDHPHEGPHDHKEHGG